MKTSTNFVAGLFLLSVLSLTSLRADAQDAPAVKILPTTENGIVKVHYAYPAMSAVSIKIYDGENTSLTDLVKGKNFETGFSKKYDLRNIKSGTCWVEITSPEVSVKYKLSGTADGKNWVANLESATYNYPAIASK